MMGKAKYTRDKQGYFSTNVFDGTYDEYGRKHYKRIRSRKSSADLEKMVQEFGALVKTGKVSRKTDTTISEYAAAWLKTKAIYTNNTQRQYADIIRYYITPMIGNVRLCELSKIHFQQLIAANSQHPRTCQLIRRTVLQIAESAVDDHLLSETVLRPLRAVQLPKYARKERRVLTDTEKAAIFAADLTPMQRCFVFLLYYCGLRRGEALGMTAADVDLKRLQARVCRSVEFIGNSSAVKPPKSQKGFRSVPLASPFAAFLREYIPTVQGDFLIHNADGGMMTQSGFRRMWESITKKLNRAAGGTDHIKVIDGLTPHIFRHNFCSELCYQVPALSTKKIAAIMGHDESMTIQVYSHILEEREDAPAAIERIFAAK